MDKLKELLKNLITDVNAQGQPSLVRIIYGGARKKSLPYKKVIIRPLLIGGEYVYQAEYYYEKKVFHDNLSKDEAISTALMLIVQDFKQINAFTETEEIQVLASKPDVPKIIRKSTASAASASKKSCCKTEADRFSHNREKKRFIPEGKPCDFLTYLGVMDENGKVHQKHYAKFRQINRYLEIVDDTIEYLPKDIGRPVRIIDFGCGKAYLTFALYYYLKVLQGRDVEIIGLDLKEDVIEFCSKVAKELGYTELKFLLGDIADYTNDYADMVVTLHACDTATDYALINAVKWNAPIILSVPCCQHELFSQIDEDVHNAMFKHGILKERFTEILTDGLRALKLEEAGYKVACIEFTSLEHTARNIMIRAVKEQDASVNKKAKSQYEALRDFYKVSPTIDKMQL